MALPHGISKATGLREALNTRCLSLHKCLAIGDGRMTNKFWKRAGSVWQWAGAIDPFARSRTRRWSTPDRAAVADYIRRVIEIITSRQIAAIVVACYQQLTKESC
jgi:hypothetical protein